MERGRAHEVWDDSPNPLFHYQAEGGNQETSTCTAHTIGEHAKKFFVVVVSFIAI